MIIENIWIVLFLWGAVYLCDYLLTIYGAKLYRRYAQEHMVFEGSYELNPAFQKDWSRKCKRFTAKDAK